MRKIYKISLAIIGAGFMLVIGLFEHPITFAQMESNRWFTPINVSQTGGTLKPAYLVDVNGVFHIIWQDEFDGFGYATGDGQNWSEPQYPDFPFPIYETTHFFITDSRERLHAFWIDNESNLYYSRVLIEGLTNPVNWTPAQLLSRTVFDLSMVADENNHLHLAYLRGQSIYDGIPAGIYYQHFLEGSSNWSEPAPIFQSPYFRTITSEEANIDIAATALQEQSTIYIAWDFTPKRQTFLARSEDTGNTWATPTPIGGTPNALYAPYGVQVEASGEQAMLLWKLGETGGACTQQYVTSNDHGLNWQAPKVLFDEQNGCPTQNHIFSTSEGFLLFSILNDQAYFLAWNSETWSLPQHQSDFSNLTDPETHLFLNLSCLKTIYHQSTFYAVGCDTLDSPDIWSTGREITDTSIWFPNPSIWSNPEEIYQDEFEIESPKIIADSEGRLHAFWSQKSDNDLIYNGVIFYSVWEQGSWSPANRIIGSRTDSAFLHQATINSEDVIYLVWESGTASGLRLSWADADQAYNANDWVSSDAIPALRNQAASPDITTSDDQNIYIAYALPLNEDRGIYLVHSPNGGNSWLEITQIADGVAKNWAMVYSPKISASGNRWEAIWTHHTLPPNSLPTGLYAASSENGGVTWSEPVEIIDGFITSSFVEVTQNRTFHRVWQKNDTGIQSLWHQYALDADSPWLTPSNILTTNDSIQAIATVRNSPQQLHLIAVIQDSFENNTLHHWIWEEERWIAGESLPLEKEVNIQPESLSAVLSPDGMLGIIFVSQKVNVADEETSYRLDFSKRAIELSNNVIVPTPTQTPEPTQSQPTITATQAPQPTEVPQLPTEPNSTPKTGRWTGLFTGGAITFGLLILFVALGFFLRYRRDQQTTK